VQIGEFLKGVQEIQSNGRAHLDHLNGNRTEEVNAKKQLLQNERLTTMGRLSAQVAHEIRNPLNAMNLNLEMLMDETANLPEAKKLIQTALNEIQRLERLTASYLEASRLNDDLTEFHPNTSNLISVSEAINETVELFQKSGLDQDISFTTKIDRSIENHHFNSDHLRPVLINLVRNSMNAMGDGGSIEIGYELNHSKPCLWVEDTGPGIPMELRQNVKQAFFTTGKGKGTGLGFSIIHNHLNKLSGKLEIKDPLHLTGIRIECHFGENSETTQNISC